MGKEKIIMNPTIGTYTTQVLADVLPTNCLYPTDIYLELENMSSANIWSWRIKYPHPVVPTYTETYREGFIGILTDDEAKVMKKSIKLFKKRFNYDFARKNKILFGR